MAAKFGKQKLREGEMSPVVVCAQLLNAPHLDAMIGWNERRKCDLTCIRFRSAQSIQHVIHFNIKMGARWTRALSGHKAAFAQAELPVDDQLVGDKPDQCQRAQYNASARIFVPHILACPYEIRQSAFRNWQNGDFDLLA